MRRSILRLGITVLVCQLLPAAASAQSALPSEQIKRRRAEAAAELFITRFRQTLDFGIAFDEVSASGGIKRLRKTGEIKSFGLNEELAKKIDDKLTARFYKASMNLYLLKSIFVIAMGEDFELRPLNREMEMVINNSKQLRHMYSDSVEDFPDVTTLGELRKFIADMERVSALYKKHLPQNVFRSNTYRASIRKIEEYRGHQFEIYKGDNYFGIAENVEVYGVCRDLFCLRLVKERGKFRILGFILGD